MNDFELQKFLYDTIKRCTGISKGVGLLYNNEIMLRNFDKSVLVCIPLETNTNMIVGFLLEDLMLTYPMSIKTGNTNYVIPFYSYIYYELMDLYNRYNNYTTIQPVFSCEDLRSLEDYENNINNKVADGIGWLKVSVNKDILISPICKYITPLTKKDSIGLDIYDGDFNSNIYRYTLFKKACKTTVFIYIRLLKLQ